MTNPIPHNVDAERATLGSVLINPESLHEIAWLTADHFYIHRHQFVWIAMVALESHGKPVDMITVSDEIERMGKSDDVPVSYLTSLMMDVPTSVNIEHYAGIVREYAQRRADLDIAREIATAAYADGVDRAKIIDLLTKNSNIQNGAVPIGDMLNKFYENVEDRAKNPKDVWGISTSFASLDKSTGGLQKHTTTMLAGAPGVGKTTLLLQILLFAARSGYKTAIYELEMDAERLIARIVSMLTGVPIRDMKSGKMENHWENFNRGIEQLERIPLFISDEPEMDTMTIRADVARLKGTRGLDLVGLDYLNLLTDRMDEDDNKNTTAKAVRFRQICRKFEVAGVSVQSVTKEGMRTAVPTLADMSGPAEVGFSADNVFFLTNDAENPERYSLLPAKMRDSDNGRKPIDLIKPKGKILFGEPARI